MKFTEDLDDVRMDSMMRHYRNEILRMQRARPTYIKIYDTDGTAVEMPNMEEIREEQEEKQEEIKEEILEKQEEILEEQGEQIEEDIHELPQELKSEKAGSSESPQGKKAVLSAFEDNKYHRVGFSKGLGFYGKFKPYEKDSASPLFFLKNSSCGGNAFMRFSSDIESDSPDTTRCERGLGLRLWDSNSQCDLLFNSLPVGAVAKSDDYEEFFLSKNRCNITGLWDYSGLWKFALKNPQSLNYLFWLFSDMGTPSSFRTTEYYSCPMILGEGDSKAAVKFKLTPTRKERPLSMYMAQELAGSDRDFLLNDLFKGVRDSISYFELGAQMIPEGEWREQESDIFNPTVLWKPSQFPVQPLGALTVEQSVKNHLSDTVKSCFRIDNLCQGLFLPDREIFREAAITMGELSRARVHIPYGFDENKFSPAPMEEHSKSPLDLIKERISDMSERESRRLAENIAESLKALDGDTLEKTLLLITDLNFSFGRALMNMLEA